MKTRTICNTLTALGLSLSLAAAPASAQTSYPQQRQNGEQILGAVVGALILGAIVHEVTKKDKGDDRPARAAPQPRPTPQQQRPQSPRQHAGNWQWQHGHSHPPRPNGHPPRPGSHRFVPQYCMSTTGPRRGYLPVADAECMDQQRPWRALPSSCVTRYGPHPQRIGYVLSCLEEHGWRLR